VVYLIGNQDVGVYFTMNFQRNIRGQDLSELQVWASATTFLRAIYESWYKTISSFPGTTPPYIKHYCLTFVSDSAYRYLRQFQEWIYKGGGLFAP
jgi:hypothetical protein